MTFVRYSLHSLWNLLDTFCIHYDFWYGLHSLWNLLDTFCIHYDFCKIHPTFTMTSVRYILYLLWLLLWTAYNHYDLLILGTSYIHYDFGLVQPTITITSVKYIQPSFITAFIRLPPSFFTTSVRNSHVSLSSTAVIHYCTASIMLYVVYYSLSLVSRAAMFKEYEDL